MIPVHKVKVKEKAIHSRNSEHICNYYLEGISALPFIAALFTIVKVWKQPKCPSVNESRKCHTHTLTQRNMIQPDYEGNPTSCNYMDEPGRNYAKWSKPDRERQILHGITFAQDLFFFLLIYLFWLCWIFLLCRFFSSYGERGPLFLALCRFLTVVASLVAEHELGGVQASVLVAPRLQSTVSMVVVHRLSCSAASGIFPEQGLNLCLLHWQADSLPLSQGSLRRILKFKSQTHTNGG